ncbi:MAG: ABC-F family ATP-binding cassette domain-containing protein [Chloroflexi bacterium]|nr:ABC-F family ATP-binding cassette domain-containing protein [Chloroflexota bacterium]
MSLLTFSSLSKSFGQHDIFSNLTGAVPYESRVGIVGPNGIGKTTLLRIMAGLDEPSGGGVTRSRGLRVGYLPQEAVDTETKNTLWEEMLTAFGELLKIESEMRRLEVAMSDAAQHEAALEKYGHVQEEFERSGGYTYEIRIKQTLEGLGFESNQYHRPLIQLSGGQKTRALLARLLLEQPDLLILDEPTNHLDIHAVEWLERFLSEWHGSVLIVSHDRYFLDEVVNKVWEISATRIEEYNGNYSAYLMQRTERKERQRREYESQQEFIAKEEDFIRRNIAGQNTAQAKGRRRRLERLKDTDGAIVNRPRELSTLNLSLNTDLRSGDRVVETHNVGVGYQDDKKVLFYAPDVLLWRGEIAALIGPNGAGKSTFLKTLLGQIPPLKGKVKLGSSLKIGYFAQAHEGLDAEKTPIEEIQGVREMPVPNARDYLAKFLFTGDDVFKKVSVLSGGERGRLALAKLAMEGANFLLLDEPTNHLDIPSQEILEAVLSDFEGTILLVSHDRYLIDALATQVWALEEGKLEVFRGNYHEYVEMKEREDGGAREKRETEERGKKLEVGSKKGDKDEKVKEKKTAKPSAEERKRAQRVQEIETMIESLEKRLAEIGDEIESSGGEANKVRELSEEYATVESELQKHIAEWEQVLQPEG